MSSTFPFVVKKDSVLNTGIGERMNKDPSARYFIWGGQKKKRKCVWWLGLGFFLLVRWNCRWNCITGVNYFRNKTNAIPLLPYAPREWSSRFFSSRNWARYLLSGPNHLTGTWVQLLCSKTSTYLRSTLGSIWCICSCSQLVRKCKC